MGPCEGSIPGPQIMALVCLDDVNLVCWPFPALYASWHSGRIPSGGITTFGPLIVKSFGFNDLNTILLNVPFGAVQLIATMGGAWLATAWNMKGPVLALLCLPPIAGCVMLLKIPHDESHKGALLVGYYIVSQDLSFSIKLANWISCRYLSTQESVSWRGLGLLAATDNL